MVPRYCFYSLVHVVQGLGMTPVFAPVDPETYALDPQRLQVALDLRVAAFGDAGADGVGDAETLVEI